MSLTIKRSGKTNQFIVEHRDGLDTVRCAVHVVGATGRIDAGLAAAAIAQALALAENFRTVLSVAVGNETTRRREQLDDLSARRSVRGSLV